MKLSAGQLKGRKTYITAIVSIILTWAAFLLGEPVAGTEVLPLDAVITLTVTSLLAIFLRNGIANQPTSNTENSNR